MANNSEGKTLLSITTAQTKPRDAIIIDDERFEVLDRGEFSLRDQQYFMRSAADLQSMFSNLAKASSEEIDAGQKKLAEIVQRLVPGLREEVLETISDSNKLKIVSAVFQNPGEENPAAETQKGNPPVNPYSNSSQGSRDSSEEASMTG